MNAVVNIPLGFILGFCVAGTMLSDDGLSWQMIYRSAPVATAVIAAIALTVAFQQWRTFKQWQLLAYVERPEFRDARRTVFWDIEKRDGRGEHWWNDRHLEKDAATVCASYDILALMIKDDLVEKMFGQYSVGTFYKTHWSFSLIATYRVLRRYIEHRKIENDKAYKHYRELAEEISEGMSARGRK